MPDKRLAGAIALMAASAVAHGQKMLDDFEHADAGLYSSPAGGSLVIREEARLDGALGARITGTDDSWFRRAEFMADAGRTYRTWVRLRGEGTASLGIGPDHADGPIRAVLVSDVVGTYLRLEKDFGAAGIQFTAVGVQLDHDRWYQLELEWQAKGDMYVRVYDESGAALAQVGPSASGRTGVARIGLRATGAGADFDGLRMVRCYADADGSGSLDLFDFLHFQNALAAGSLGADCDGNGTLDFFDFLCFQNEFAAGCPDLPEIARVGTGAPPISACGRSLTSFPLSAVPDRTDVSSVKAPCGLIRFSTDLERRSVSAGSWSKWGYGYTGDVYYVDNWLNHVTITMPPGTTRFRLGIKPVVLLDHEFRITAIGKNGIQRITPMLNGLNDAETFTFCDDDELLAIYVQSPDRYGIGDFAIRQVCPTVSPLGDAAPSITLCGRIMTPFKKDTRSVFTDVSDVPSPLGDNVHFSIPLAHRAIGFGWGAWSHGYSGTVYYTDGSRSVTLRLPDDTERFRFYAQPSAFEDVQVRVSVNGGADTAVQTIHGDAGAKAFGVCGPVESITISTPLIGGGKDFAIGEFSIAR